MAERAGLTRATLLMAFLLGACGQTVEQTDACSSYVACEQALDEERPGSTNLVRFEAGGDCWSSEGGAELCDLACEKGLAFLRDRIEDLPEACEP